MQSSRYPGLNPDGDYSCLTERNVLKQADALAAKLEPYGYEYVNIDAGWWRDVDWKPRFDEYGRQAADPGRFPRGMKAVADDLHAKGLKADIYLPVGLEKETYGGGKVPVWNADGCTTADIVHGDLRTTNGWDSARDRLRLSLRPEVHRLPGPAAALSDCFDAFTDYCLAPGRGHGNSPCRTAGP